MGFGSLRRRRLPDVDERCLVELTSRLGEARLATHLAEGEVEDLETVLPIDDLV